MKASEILESAEMKKIVEFHGHVCPGMMIGYRAAKEGMALLKAQRAEDEEIAAIVENDACGTDAVQVLTGCTFGKGNFFFKDYGKQAFTFFSRATGKGVRLALKADAAAGAETREQKIEMILEARAEDLFNIAPAKCEMPPMAKVMRSETCARCGEPAMPTKMKEAGGERVCRACAGE